MADIAIYIISIGGCDDSDYVNVGGYARCTGMSAELGNIVWDVNIPLNSLASTANTAIKNAAIAAAEALEYTIGALDKKTLYGGAVGL